MIIYNTEKRIKESFQPIKEGQVSMYVCGPTVYDYIHVGNARPMVVFDAMHRFFRYRGYDVRYVVNFTDIDDKIINRARDEGTTYDVISERYIAAFKKHAEALNLLEEETIHPRATQMIPEMIAFIQGLMDKGYAYDADDAVYFRVDKVDDYGKLSGKQVEDLKSGARIQVNESKENPLDFALWKKKKEADEPSWESPWGEGRPGWHIECSTMSKTILADTLDIHAGGEDLEFPHHENEIAQSEALTGKPFANYWMHNGMIMVQKEGEEAEKMSKSKNNFFSIHDVEKEYDLMIIRLWLLSAHYRTPIIFSKAVLEQTKNGYQRLMNGLANLERLEGVAAEKELSEAEKAMLAYIAEKKEAFIAFMEDDLNTADALSALFEMVKRMNADLSDKSSREAVISAKKTYTELLDVLGIEDRTKVLLDEEIEALIAKRNDARDAKDYALADAIRDELLEKGIVLKDTRSGVVWSRDARTL